MIIYCDIQIATVTIWKLRFKILMEHPDFSPFENASPTWPLENSDILFNLILYQGGSQIEDLQNHGFQYQAGCHRVRSLCEIWANDHNATPVYGISNKDRINL